MTDPVLRPVLFTVDSALLRELGERLVGRQYIALAELIKNSYDADATRVDIRITHDSISVSDNGHGLTEQDFVSRWMRVGSAHKVREELSPRFRRPLTGSKGIGRLAVQFLAADLEMRSVPHADRLESGQVPQEILVKVDWERAVNAGDLTKAEAFYGVTDPNPDSRHGTQITLRRLRHAWNRDDYLGLAREIWFLQPPFRAMRQEARTESGQFRVRLSSDNQWDQVAFNEQMSRIVGLYESRLVGTLAPPQKETEKRTMRISLELEGRPPMKHNYDVPVLGEGSCLIDNLDFEIRIFRLMYRQPYGISVQQARDYMAEWGGVHIYDGSFRIPYAGPAADWLRLEVDHSHRLTKSQLLPDELNAPLGLNFLPTNSRVLGIVNINTAQEAQAAQDEQEHLEIQVSRDRLVSNEAFYQMRDGVRYALDYYATRLATLRLRERLNRRPVRAADSLAADIREVLKEYRGDIPQPVYQRMSTAVDKTIDSVREQSDWARTQSGLLGAMATVGATALAFDHQYTQQLNILDHHISVLEKGVSEGDLDAMAKQLREWVRHARGTRSFFLPVTDPSLRTTVARFGARTVLKRFVESLQYILRGITVDLSNVAPDVLLPQASYPLWMAIFNNVLLNASNAMLGADHKHVAFSSFQDGTQRGIDVQDTGVGVDLATSEDLFKPLVRRLEISQERRALGYGGTGLGLAIVRMLATDINADVHFVQASAPYTTCFRIRWSEQG